MTLYAKWTTTAGAAQSGSSQQSVSQTGSATAQQTAKAARQRHRRRAPLVVAAAPSGPLSQAYSYEEEINPLPLFFSHAGDTPDRRHKAFPQKREHGTLPVQLIKTNR